MPNSTTDQSGIHLSNIVDWHHRRDCLVPNRNKPEYIDFTILQVYGKQNG